MVDKFGAKAAVSQLSLSCHAITIDATNLGRSTSDGDGSSCWDASEPQLLWLCYDGCGGADDARAGGVNW